MNLWLLLVMMTNFMRIYSIHRPMCTHVGKHASKWKISRQAGQSCFTITRVEEKNQIWYRNPRCTVATSEDQFPGTYFSPLKVAILGCCSSLRYTKLLLSPLNLRLLWKWKLNEAILAKLQLVKKCDMWGRKNYLNNTAWYSTKVHFQWNLKPSLND